MNWWQNKSHPPASRRLTWTALLVLAGLVLAVTAWSCGPFFPRWLLSNSDEAVQSVPVASFFKEIAVWRQDTHSRYQMVLPKEDQSQADQVVDADLTELREVLLKNGIKPGQLEKTLKAHQECRTKLQTYSAAMADWLAEPFDWETKLLRPMPEMGPNAIAPGLPPEFADYMRGSIAYHLGKTNDAVTAWTALLQRPAAERHYRSVWAEYMLGRAAVDSAPAQAVLHFQQVRALVLEGFADSTGLAAASLGWEARAWLQLKDYCRAIALYSEQVTAGDQYYAVVSLRRTVEAAFAEGESAVKALAGDAASRRVVTATLISQDVWSEKLAALPAGEPGEVWLKLLEENQATEVELAEQLALVAYQSGKFEQAERWLKRAPKESATARWLQAKLLLRAGRIEPAAQLLAGLAREFPATIAVDLGDDVSSNLLDRLHTGEDYGEVEALPGRQNMLGELGVLHLHRRDYISALDCLLRGGYWMDAAYVAERVLTLDELKTYVDRSWPPAEQPSRVEDGNGRSTTTDSIRYLLARRLTRENRLQDAVAYLPFNYQALHKERSKWLAISQDPKRPAKERGRALWEAAKITRESGLELLGTEVEPDWAVHDGGFEVGVTVEDRWQQQTNAVLKTSADELQRAARHEVAPRERWHYRYLAADLGWQAAQLLPDQSPETARILYQGGGWLKGVDPKAANRFYRALVLRCNKTELGSIAEKLHWFPPLDEQGKPYLPKRVPHAKMVEPVESFPVF